MSGFNLTNADAPLGKLTSAIYLPLRFEDFDSYLMNVSLTSLFNLFPSGVLRSMLVRGVPLTLLYTFLPLTVLKVG